MAATPATMDTVSLRENIFTELLPSMPLI
jgi:hypothetical protein